MSEMKDGILSLKKLVDELLLPHGWRNAIVMQSEQPAGLITLGDSAISRVTSGGRPRLVVR